MPLVLTFHGMGSSSLGQIDLTGFDKLAEREGFILIAPNSTIIDSDGTITSTAQSGYDGEIDMNSKHWNAGYPSIAVEHNIDDVGYISALIDKFVAEHDADPKRVYATGMSSGGAFALKLAIELSDKIAAVGCMASRVGVLLSESTPKEPIKVVSIVGTDDPAVQSPALLSTEDTTAYWLSHYELTDVEPVVKELPQTAVGDNTKIIRYEYSSMKTTGQYVFYEVEGGGHGWLGGPQYLPEETIGIVSQHVCGTELLWSEFKNVSKP